MNIDLVDDILCYFCLLAKKTDTQIDILIKLLKMLSTTFKDLVVVSENSAIIAKFICLLKNEEHKLLFGIQKHVFPPSVSFKIY